MSYMIKVYYDGVHSTEIMRRYDPWYRTVGYQVTSESFTGNSKTAKYRLGVQLPYYAAVATLTASVSGTSNILTTTMNV